MSAIFNFAKCSSCSQCLADGTPRCYTWLGNCGHRLCVQCAPQQPLVCPCCHGNRTAFKTIHLSNATHVVELLSSCLTEVTERLTTLEKMISTPRPLPPSKESNLFAIPLSDTHPRTTSSYQHPTSSIHIDTNATTTDNLFALFPPTRQSHSTHSPSTTRSTRLLSPTSRPPPSVSEAFNGPMTKRERTEWLEGFMAPNAPAAKYGSSHMTKKSEPTMSKASIPPKNTQTKTKKAPTHQTAQSSLVPPKNISNPGENPSMVVKRSNKAFLDGLRAKFNE